MINPKVDKKENVRYNINSKLNFDCFKKKTTSGRIPATS